MEFKQVVYAIMTLAIIGFGIALIYNFDSPLIKQLLGTEVPGENLKPTDGITPFKQFVKEYKECSTLPDDNCICPITTFSLPKNTFIEIENFGSLASLNYFEGTIKSSLNDPIAPNYGLLIEGCKPKPQLKPGEEQRVCSDTSDYTVKQGSLLIPNSFFTNYFDSSGNFDTSRYTTDTMLFFSSDGAGSTSIKTYTTTNVNGYNEFNFEGIYKKGNSLYLLDSPYTALIDTFGKSGRLEKVDELYTQVKACKKPEGYDEAKLIYDSILQKSESCSKDKVIAPLQCESVKTNLPAKYKILISKSNLQLIYESSVISNSDKIKFGLIPDPSTGKFQELSGTLSIESSDPNSQGKIIQLDIYKCPGNIACIWPRTEISKYV